MNERTLHVNIESPAALAPLPGWDAFEHILAPTLSVLKDEFLVLSTKKGNRYVQFNVCPEKGVFAEVVSNAYLEPAEKLTEEQVAALLALGWAAPTRAPGSPPPASAPKGSPNFFREFPSPYACPEISRFAVRTLTEVLRIESPYDLEYKSFDASGHAVTLPALHIDRVAAPRPKAKAPSKPKGPPEFARLRAKVLAAARSGSGLGSLEYDEDGTLQVPIGSRTGWIRPCEKPFYVRVHLHLLSNVDVDEEFLARMHEVNSRLPIARIIYKTGSVFLGVDFPAMPFRAEHLTQAVVALSQLADEVLSDLRRPGAEATAMVVNS